jgi:hypothetical protein
MPPNRIFADLSKLRLRRLEVAFFTNVELVGHEWLPSHPDYTSCLPFFQLPFSKKLLGRHRLGTICVLLLSTSSRTSHPNPANCVECGTGWHWHSDCRTSFSRDAIQERKSDRLLREPMRLLRVINRLRAKMGAREDFRPCAQRP